MTPRMLKTLGLSTLLVAVAAGVVAIKKDRAVASSHEASDALFPELQERINDVTEVSVANAEGAFTVARGGDDWGMPAKGGFPVDFAKVKELIVSVSKLEKLEPMTRNPERWAKLGLEDVGEPDAVSTIVRMADADGTELAHVVIGNTHRAKASAGKPSLYVRVPGDDQTWQVTGRVFVDPTEGNWLEKEIIALGRERVARVTTRHPDGEVLVVEKAAPEDDEWAVADVPEGRELSWAGVAGSIAGAVARLNLQDVKPTDEVEFDEAQGVVAEFATWDGLLLTVRVIEVEDQSYLKLSTGFDPALRSDAGMGPEPPPAEAPETAEGEEPTADEPVGKTAEEVQAEVAELDARLSKWVYVVPGYQASNFKKRMADLLKELPDPDAQPVQPGGGELGPPTTLEDLFPDGLPPELEGIDFGGDEPLKLGDALGTEAPPDVPEPEDPPADEPPPAPDDSDPPPASDGDDAGRDDGSV